MLAAVSAPINQVVQYDTLLTRTDTRTLAKEWIERHIPSGTKIAMERGRFLPGYAPHLKESPESIQRNYLISESGLVAKGYTIRHVSSYYRLLMEATTGVTYEITPILYDEFAGQTDFWQRDPPHTLEAYRAQGIRYVVTSGFEQRVPANPSDEITPYIQPYLAFYSALKDQATLIQEFPPIGRLGPHIRIYELKEMQERQ